MISFEKQYAQFQDECITMQLFLEEETGDDPTVMVEKIAKMSIYMARSGKLLADAKKVQDLAIKDAFHEYSDRLERMSPTTAKYFLNAVTAEANYFVTWLDRINRSLVHSSDNLRTQISFSKEEMRITKTGY